MSGSFDGAGWSPRFVTSAITLDGEPVTGYIEAGAGTLHVTATDDAGRLRLELVLDLSTSGLHAPAWWGPGTSAGEPVAEFAFRYQRFPEPSFPGGTFLGATLRTVGLASPRVHPDQVTIYLVDEV